MSTAMTAAQLHRLSDTSHANWKCFPAPYVIPEQRSRSRSRSRNRNRNRNLSHSYNSTPHQWQEEPVQRPFTAAPAVDHDPAQPIRPTRSRSRLQKRPSQRTLEKSASAAAMSQSASHPRGPSRDQQDMTASPQSPDQLILRRHSSLRRKPIAEEADRTSSRKERPEQLRPTQPAHALLSVRSNPSQPENNIKTESDSEGSPSSGGIQSPTNLPRTPRHQPLAPNDPSPLNPAYHIPSQDFASAGTMEPVSSANLTSQRNEHVLLPAGFKPGKTEHTYVEEIMMPAVTHEVLKHNKTEIVQEEITREIHVHHYYTYTQPIKTVEILPARHFIVDGQTGEKVEIPAPEGWTMPSNLQPYKPDPSGIAVETRHYLVDEDHPSGILEPAPPDVGKSNPELRKKKSSASAKWTPFPKVR